MPENYKTRFTVTIKKICDVGLHFYCSNNNDYNYKLMIMNMSHTAS